MNTIHQPLVHELTGPEASQAWDAWSDTIPGDWALVPIEQDATAQKLERAGFSSRQNDPTLKGWK